MSYDFNNPDQLPGIKALRAILLRLRSERQDGYISYEGDGEWSFVSTSLPQTTPEELNALFTLAGLEPDVVVPLGVCEDCAHSIERPHHALLGKGVAKRTSRGNGAPCHSCAMPRHDLFVPLRRRKRAA